jgi:hypothetical protein
VLSINIAKLENLLIQLFHSINKQSMGQLLKPGEHEMKGPWVLSEDAIAELEGVVTFINTKISELNLKDYNEKQYRGLIQGYNETNETFEERETANKKAEADEATKLITEITLSDKKENKLKDDSINALLRDAHLKNFKPLEFEISIKSRIYYGSSFIARFNKYNSGVKYSARCSNNDVEEEILYKFEKWLEKYKPNRAKVIWNDYNYVLVPVFLLLSFSLVPYLYDTVTTNYIDYKSIYRNEVIQFIKSGVNKDNQAKALESLMKYEIDYSPTKPEVKQVLNKTVARIALTLVLLAVISFFRPISIIGLGKNKGKVSIYNLYTKIVLVTIPSAIFLPLLWNAIRVLFGLK